MVPYGSTRTDEGQTFIQARQGNPEAIAHLLNRALNPRGVGAQVYPESEGLTVVLEAGQVPSQAEWVPFVQQGISQLGVPNLRRVRVVGMQAGQPDYAWQEAVALNPPPPTYPSPPSSGLPITNFELGNGTAVGQQIAYGDKVLQLTGHGAVVMANAHHLAANLRTRPAPEPGQSIPPVSQWVGREAELQGAIAALRDSQPVQFYGEPGLGKTTLVRSLVHQPEVRSLCPDGILYHSVRDQSLEDVLHSLFGCFFEYDATIPQKPTLDQIYQSFRGRRALIALDDVELDSTQVHALVNHLPSVHLMLASPNHHPLAESFSMPLGGLPMAEAIALMANQLGYGFTPDEQPAVEALCHTLNGHPLAMRQAIALVQHRHLSLPGLAQQLQAPATLGLLVLRSCALLPEPERRVLAALGVLGSVPVRLHHFSGLIGVANPQSILENLEQRGILTSDGYRYSLAENLLPLLRKHWNLTPWVQPVVNYFLRWIQNHATVTGAVTQDGNLLLWVMEQAAQHQQWSEVVRLARLMDAPFLVDGQWGRWEQLWRLGLQAGEALGDQEAIAQAYHQLGTRALSLNDAFTANAYLTQAMQMREGMGQATAAQASYHNLQWLAAAGPDPWEGGTLQGAIAPQAELSSLPIIPINPGPSTAVASPSQRGIPPVVQVGLVSALFLGLGSLLAVQMLQNRGGLSVSPNQLTFGNQEQNRTSVPQAVTVQNTGNGLLELTRINLVGTNPTDFQLAANACNGVPLAPDQSCVLQITFTPQGDGNRTAELTVSDRNRSVEQRIFLTGTSSADAIPGPITLSFQPGNQDFGDYAVGQSSESRRIVLRNESNQPVTVQGISPVGDAKTDFTVTHDCTGAPLAAGQSCSITVSFRPSVPGQRTANVAVTDSANNLWNIPLRGNGMVTQPQVPALGIRPGALNYGDQPVQTPSQEQIITLSNTGNQTLTISQVYLEGGNGFSIRRNTCVRTPLAPGDACSVGIVFNPPGSGSQSGNLIIASNDPRGNARIFLSGNGIVPEVAELNVTPTTLNFGAVELESTSRPQTVTLRNGGTARLTIGQIRASGNGDFVSDADGAIGEACSNRALQPGEACRFGVVFLPYVEGDRMAQITIPNDAPQGDIAVQLQGQGQVQRFPSLSVSPASLSFATYAVGSKSPAQPITLFNGGSVPLNLGNLVLDGTNPNDFVASSDSSFSRIACSNVTLQPGERCALQLTFGPLEGGDRRAQLVIPSNDPNGSFRVNLTGTGEVVSPVPYTP